MLKLVKPIIIKKIWGYEKWIYSSYKNNKTKFVNGQSTPKGPLIKIIKTNKSLSVQVHPNDKWASILENEKNGKTESWYILDAKKNSELILGMKNYEEKFIKKNVYQKKFLNNLNKIKAIKNNFYNIPAGYVHGLGANITVLEVQQSSNITYRYYDYDRLENGKPRELHIEKALQVQKNNLTHNLKPISKNPLTYKNKYFTQSFLFEKSNVEKNSIVVDLETHNCYFVKNKTLVNFKHYVVIKVNK